MPNEASLEFLQCLKEEGFKRILVNEDFVIPYTRGDTDDFKESLRHLIKKNKITVVISYVKLPRDVQSDIESQVTLISGTKNQSFEFFIQLLKLRGFI